MGSHFDSIQRGAIPARPSLSHRRGRLPLHIYIAALFRLLIIGVAGVIAWRNYVENRKLIISASQELAQAIGGKTVAAFTSIYRPAEMLIDLLARQRLSLHAEISASRTRLRQGGKRSGQDQQHADRNPGENGPPQPHGGPPAADFCSNHITCSAS